MIPWLFTATAWPCAGLVHSDGVTAESDAAQIVIEVGNDDVRVSYLATYTGDAPGVGWIIPVFGELATVGDGDRELFDTLAQVSQPIIDAAPEPTCACGPAPGDAKAGGSNDLEILAEGFTGTYEWTALAADDPEALTDWLTDRAFASPNSDDLDHYIALGATFVAVTVRPSDPETAEGGRELPPFAVTTEGLGSLRYPSVMARSATVEAQRTVVYVLGTSRAVISEGWDVLDLTQVEGPAGADGYQVLEDEIARLGASRTWARTYAGDTIDGFLTRFDLAAATDLHTDDAVFALEDTTDEIRTAVILGGGSQAGLWLVPILGLGLLARRR